MLCDEAPPRSCGKGASELGQRAAPARESREAGTRGVGIPVRRTRGGGGGWPTLCQQGSRAQCGEVWKAFPQGRWFLPAEPGRCRHPAFPTLLLRSVGS